MKKWVLWIVLTAVILTTANCSRSLKDKYDRPSDPPSEFNKSGPTFPIKKMNAQTNKKKNQLTNGIVPARLYIPSIDLHANIEPVSVSNEGQMGVPHSTGRVGYLANGVLPGAVGNAVMDGHVDNYEGPAVFFRLRKLKKGDNITVKNDKGCTITFFVESVDYFKTSEAPLSKIFGPINEPRLNLITCAGKYSRKKREHEGRLVVFAKRAMNG